MTRRDYLGAIMKAGLIYSVPFATFWGCDANEEGFKAIYIDNKDFDFLAILAETILPKTDTIGAIEAGVPHFIELYLQHCLDTNTKNEYLKSLNLYRERLSVLKIEFKKPSPELAKQWIKDEKHVVDNALLDFMKKTKMMTLKGYFHNQKAIEQNFNYLPVPKEYRACVDVIQTDKLWIN